MAVRLGDREFFKALRESERWRWLTAYWMSENGWVVKMRPRQEQGDDRGDLFVRFGDEVAHDAWRRIEAKHRKNLVWTGAHDFRYPTMIVCEPYTWDRAVPKPYEFVIWNKDASHCAIVPGSTHQYWQREWLPDSRYGGEYKWFYTCSLELCCWESFATEEEPNETNVHPTPGPQ